MNQHWRLLNYSLCADKADGVDALHEWKEFQGEYGCPWHEFLNDYTDEIDELIQAWWNNLPIGEQREMFEDQRADLIRQLDAVNKTIEELCE